MPLKGAGDMNNKISVNLCTVCHKSFSFSLTGNRKMCPGCRVQKKEGLQERGHREMLIFVSVNRERMAG